MHIPFNKTETKLLAVLEAYDNVVTSGLVYIMDAEPGVNY